MQPFSIPSGRPKVSPRDAPRRRGAATGAAADAPDEAPPAPTLAHALAAKSSAAMAERADAEGEVAAAAGGMVERAAVGGQSGLRDLSKGQQ